MERQSSFGSAASGGSARSSATRVAETADKANQEDTDGQGGLLTGLFGVLYTLAKEKLSDNAKVALANVIIDFLLILAIFLHLEFPWAVNYDSPFYIFLWFLEVHRPLADKGANFYVIPFYVMVSMLYVSVAICLWVAWCFKNNNFPYVWPIKLARVVISFFFITFYIAAINIFFVMTTCSKHGSEWTHHLWGLNCLETPLLIHCVIAWVSVVTFATVALLLVMADHELEPLASNVLAAPHSMTELKSISIKTIISFADIMLVSVPKAQGVIFVIATWSILYFHIKELPYYNSWVNVLRVAFYSVHFWVASCLCVLVFRVHATKPSGHPAFGIMRWEIENMDEATMITNAMIYGSFPAFVVGGLTGFLRLLHFFRVALKFRAFKPETKSRRIHKFSNEMEVEVASRVCRVWDEDHIPDPQAVDLGENVLKAGIQQFPNRPLMRIVFANFLIDVRQQHQSGWGQLELAKRMHPNLSFRFSMFTREQEHKQKAAAGSAGDQSADLVSYVEFQKNYKNLLLYHKAALLATRDFWRLLLRSEIPLVTLTRSFRRIDMMEGMADKTYKLVLEKYPKSVKLLRSYATFLETVKNDPWAAAKYHTEAEKAEEAAENQAQDVAVDENGNPVGGDSSNAMVTINAQGVIQTANKAAQRMFGYKRADLEKKNVSMLMPPPFSTRHDSYLSNYINTGKAKILDSQREVVALHADHYVFPVKIMVTRASGTGQDSTFMGVLKNVESDAAVIRAWLMTTGMVLCVDQNFIDYAGWEGSDLIGKPFADLGEVRTTLEELLEVAATKTEAELADGAVEADVVIKHKFADGVKVHLKIEMGGTEDQRLLVAIMKRTGATEPMTVFDHKAKLVYTNNALATMLGMKASRMKGKDISDLIEMPFGMLHHKWIKDQDAQTTKPPSSSCRSGMVANLVSVNGTRVPVRMRIVYRQDGEHQNFVVKYDKVSVETALDDRRLVLTVNDFGTILSASASPQSLFHFNPQAAVGKSITDIIDVFEMWEKEGHDPVDALGAFLLRSISRPGISWRVGVSPQYSSDEEVKAAAKAQAATLMQRMLMSRQSSLSATKGAIMQVEHVKSDADGVTAIATTDLQTPVARVLLWRPDFLTGVLELDKELKVSKADLTTGLLFGVPNLQLHGKLITRYITLPTNTNHDLLLGNKPGPAGTGRSAMKAHAGGGHHHHRIGPKKSYPGSHADGLQLMLGVQACVKPTRNKDARLLCIIKTASTVRGTLDTVTKVVEEAEADTGFAAEGHGSGSGSGSEARFSMEGSNPEGEVSRGGSRGPSPVPKLNLAGIGGGGRSLGRKPSLTRHLSKQTSNAKPGPPPALYAFHNGIQVPGQSTQRSSKDGGETTGRTDNSGGVLTSRDVGLVLGTARTGAGSRPGSATNLSPSVGHALSTIAENSRPGSGKNSLDLPVSRLKSGSPFGSKPHRTDAAAAVFSESPQPGSTGSQSQSSGGAPLNGSNKMSDDSAMVRKGGRMLNKVFSSRGRSIKEWDHVDHVDPDMVPIPENAEYDIEHHQVEKDMDVSSGGSDSEDGSCSDELARARSKTMEALDDEDKKHMQHAIRVAKEWLDNNYQFKRQESDVSNPVPGLHGMPNPTWDTTEKKERAAKLAFGSTSRHAKFKGKDDLEDVKGTEANPEELDEEEGEKEGEKAKTSDPQAGSSTFRRGKRLRRLLKLLCGAQANRGLHRLRTHMWAIVALVLLMHLACFVIVLVFIQKQTEFITQIASAGEAIDLVHVTATYSRATDAAFRSYWFNASGDVPIFASTIKSDADRLEYLHQGLYLGFGKLKTLASSHLDQIWNDPVRPALTYQDTNPPSYVVRNISLWTLGNDYVSALREVAYVSEVAVGVRGRGDSSANSTLALLPTLTGPSSNITYLDMHASRFWLFVRDNGPAALYDGYLSVINTVLTQGQDNISQLKNVMLIVMVVEVVVVLLGASTYVLHMLRVVAAQRAALFTVFLVIPTGFLKALSNKRMQLGAADDDDDDEDEGTKRRQRTISNIGDGSGNQSGSVHGEVMYERSSASQTQGPGSKRVSMFANVMGQNDSAKDHYGGTGGKQSPEPSRNSFAGMPIRRQLSGEVDVVRGIFNGKRLTKTGADLYRLVVPFVLYACVLVVIYMISWASFNKVERDMVSLKLLERSLDQSSRVVFWANELALERPADMVSKQQMSRVLSEEAAWLDVVYSTALYGGPTLNDSLSDGSDDTLGQGSLFASTGHASALFQAKGCLRSSEQGPCPAEGEAFHEVAQHAVDPMVRRLITDAGLMAREGNVTDVTPFTLRYQYVWNISRVDMRTGLEALADVYTHDALKTFKAQESLQIALLALTLVAAFAYMFWWFKPLLKVMLQESRRVAELLSQLPSDMDVEGMVEASWKAVLKQELDRRALNMAETHSRATSFAGVMKSVMSRISIVGRAFSHAGSPKDVHGPHMGKIKDGVERSGPSAAEEAMREALAKRAAEQTKKMLAKGKGAPGQAPVPQYDDQAPGDASEPLTLFGGFNGLLARPSASPSSADMRRAPLSPKVRPDFDSALPTPNTTGAAPAGFAAPAAASSAMSAPLQLLVPSRRLSLGDAAPARPSPLGQGARRQALQQSSMQAGSGSLRHASGPASASQIMGLQLTQDVSGQPLSPRQQPLSPTGRPPLAPPAVGVPRRSRISPAPSLTGAHQASSSAVAPVGVTTPLALAGARNSPRPAPLATARGSLTADPPPPPSPGGWARDMGPSGAPLGRAAPQTQSKQARQLLKSPRGRDSPGFDLEPDLADLSDGEGDATPRPSSPGISKLAHVHGGAPGTPRGVHTPREGAAAVGTTVTPGAGIAMARPSSTNSNGSKEPRRMLQSPRGREVVDLSGVKDPSDEEEA